VDDLPRLNVIARYPSSLSLYSHYGLSGSKSVRCNSIGVMKRAEELPGACILAEVALLLRPIRLDEIPTQWPVGSQRHVLHAIRRIHV
jgi:hypothetical protein